MKRLASKFFASALAISIVAPMPAYSLNPAVTGAIGKIGNYTEVLVESDYVNGDRAFYNTTEMRDITEEEAAMRNNEKMQQKRGMWISPANFASGDSSKFSSLKPVSQNSVPSECRGGGVSASKTSSSDTKSPIRTVFFSGSATSSYMADQHDPAATTPLQEKHFPLTCSISIVNWSPTTQYIRWGALMTMQQQGTARDAAGNSQNNPLYYRSLVSRALQFNARSATFVKDLGEAELNPAANKWIAIGSGEAIDLKLDLGLPVGLPGEYKSNAQSVPQFCTGYVQACDRPDSQFKGELLVSGEMQYVQDAPANVQIQYATSAREKGSDAGRVVTLSPNCFRDHGRSGIGYQSLSAEVYNSKACKAGTGPAYGNACDPESTTHPGQFSYSPGMVPATFGNTSQLAPMFEKYEGGIPLKLSGSGPSTIVDEVLTAPDSPLMARNTSFTLSHKAAGRFFASQAEYGGDEPKLFCQSSDLSPIAPRLDKCRSLTAYDTEAAKLKGIEASRDIIEDVGGSRFRGRGTMGQECFSYQELDIKNGVTFNHPLRTGMFPMHIGTVGIMVNGGQTF